MNLIDYGRIVIRRGWIALLLAVIAGAATFVFSQQMTPVYQSTQRILIVPVRTDNGLTIAATNLLNSHRIYLDSDIVAARIIDRLRLDMTAQELRGATTIVANRENLTIQVDVALPAPDAPMAAELINPIAYEWGQELIQWRETLNQLANREDRVEARVQDNPQLAKLRPNVRIYTLIGSLAGLFLGAIVIFVLEYLESNIIRRREDLEQQAGLKVLAAVPAE